MVGGGGNGKMRGKGMNVVWQSCERCSAMGLGGCPTTITPLGTGHSKCVPFKHKSCLGRGRGVS